MKKAALILLAMIIIFFLLISGGTGAKAKIIGEWERYVDLNNPFNEVLIFNENDTYEIIHYFNDGTTSVTGAYEIKLDGKVWLKPNTNFLYYKYKNGNLEAVHDSVGTAVFTKRDKKKF